MQEIFHVPEIIAAKAALGISGGEGHLHESEISCTSYFTYPNQDGLKGIGLHTHSFCDDIEVLIKGKVACFRDYKRAFEIEAPFLIVNAPMVPHSLVNTTQSEILVLSVRSPKSYEGNVVDRKASTAYVPFPKQRFISLKDGSPGSEVIAETDRTLILSHCVAPHTSMSLGTQIQPERALVLVTGNEVTVQAAGQCSILMRKASLMIESGSKSMSIENSSDQSSRLLEIIPKAKIWA